MRPDHLYDKTAEPVAFTITVAAARTRCLGGYMSTRIAVIAGCVAAIATVGIQAHDTARAVGSLEAERVQSSARAAKGETEFATSTRLPSLGSSSEALGVNEDGTVIAGHSFDRAGMLYAVKWTLQSGRWIITTLPYPGSAAGRAVNNAGDVVGYGATAPRRAVLWPSTGGYIALGCDSDQTLAHAISARGQVVGGQGPGAVVGPGPSGAAVWQSAQDCRDDLPALAEGWTAFAAAVNGDGTMVGGSGSGSFEGGVPVRWTHVGDQWSIDLLDSRQGRVSAANARGDLAGHVSVPCTSAAGCLRARIWHAAGGARELATLGGADSWARGINADGEVVGLSTSADGVTTAFFWSEARGMVALPVKDARPRPMESATYGLTAPASLLEWMRKGAPSSGWSETPEHRTAGDASDIPLRKLSP